MKKEPLSIALSIYTFLFSLLVGVLLIFHMYFIITDTTTVEFKKVLSFKFDLWKKNHKLRIWWNLKKNLFNLTSVSLLKIQQPTISKIPKQKIAVFCWEIISRNHHLIILTLPDDILLLISGNELFSIKDITWLQFLELNSCIAPYQEKNRTIFELSLKNNQISKF